MPLRLRKAFAATMLLDQAPAPAIRNGLNSRLGVPPIKVVEHHRSIRDGAETILAGDLSALDLERLQRMFKSKPGPGGGFDVDAYGRAFFLDGVTGRRGG